MSSTPILSDLTAATTFADQVDPVMMRRAMLKRTSRMRRRSRKDD